MPKMHIKASLNYSPNFSTYKRTKNSLKYLIIHYTGMDSESKAINRLTNVNSNVSCHYFIKRDGGIILMIPELYVAWHAGKSHWKNDISLNLKSIGIEISNKGHEFGYQNFTKRQIKSLIRLSKYLMKKYKINKKNVLGHSDISSDRKKDPGEKFPWEYLSKNKIGIWHKIKKDFLKKTRNNKISKKEKVEFFKYLNNIGYNIKIYKSYKKTLLVKNFQRHFRQSLINGRIDKECLLIAKNLSYFN